MNIRPLAIAAFVSVLIPAGCGAPAPTANPLPIPTPVPIATWVAQGIPSDLEITYDNFEGIYFDEELRITADGSATYTIHSESSTLEYAGKLSPEALKRAVLAFEDRRFFYLTLAEGCVVDVTSTPPSSRNRLREVVSGFDIPQQTVSIRINAISKELRRDTDNDCPDSEGQANFLRLQEFLRGLGMGLPTVTPTQTGAVRAGASATPTGP